MNKDLNFIVAESLSPCLGGTHPGVSAHWHLQSPGPWMRASSATRSRSCWSLWFCSSLLCCSPSHGAPRPGAGLAAPKNLAKKWICTFKQGEGILQYLFSRKRCTVLRVKSPNPPSETFWAPPVSVKRTQDTRERPSPSSITSELSFAIFLSGFFPKSLRKGLLKADLNTKADTSLSH